MIFRCRRRVFACWPHLLFGLLSACGGGAAVIAIVSVVTPLAGDWKVSDTEKLNFDSVPPEVVFFGLQLGEVNITATVLTATNVCGGGFALATGGTNVPLVGTLDNGVLMLRREDSPNSTNTCLQGTFTDLRTISAGPPGLPTMLYQNDRVDVQMDLGLWVSDGNAPLKLKFNEPFGILANNNSAFFEGCVVSVSPPDLFDSDSSNEDMNGFVTATSAKPTIPEVRSKSSGLLLFSQVIFEDGATLTLLNSSGEPVTLHRKPDTTTTCP